MSRSYSILCLSHDPAFEINRGTWNRREEVEHSIAERDVHEAVAVHPHCDLVMAEYSGGLISLGCPARTLPSQHVPFHSIAMWEDVKWLRLLLAARAEVSELKPAGLMKAVHAIPGCWSERRLNRLATLLG